MVVTMKNLNDRISALEGVAPRTPITMKNLNDRLTALEKSSVVSIITINKSGTNLYPIPTEHQGKNFVVLSSSHTVYGRLEKEAGGGITDGKTINLSGRSNTTSSGGVSGRIIYSVSGTNIVASYSGDSGSNGTYSSSIKVLFYK